MGFQEAVASVFSKYATFSGRAPRSEYWYFALFNLIASIVLTIADSLLGTMSSEGDVGLLGGIFSLAILIPGISVGVRRLHDINKSGWWLFIILIPIIGIILLIVWHCTKGTDGANDYGSDPLAGITRFGR